MTTIKACNILGSGPCRRSYQPNGLINIGANFPWTNFDYTVISHKQPILKYLENPDLFPEPMKFIINDLVWVWAKKSNVWDLIKDRVVPQIIKNIGFKNNAYLYSSGHYAALWALSQGYNKLNLYGFDTYFGTAPALDNWSHTPGTPHYIDPTTTTFLSDDHLARRDVIWKKTWLYMQQINPEVEFNFIP